MDRWSMLLGCGVWGFCFSRVCIFWLLPIFVDVLHDQRNPAVRRILWIIRFAKHLISETSDLGDLIWSHSILLQDRKSTRLNSSHQIISYAVFCLKKKTSERRKFGERRRPLPARPTAADGCGTAHDRKHTRPSTGRPARCGRLPGVNSAPVSATAR